MRKRFLHDEYGKNEVFWEQTWDCDWREKLLAPPPIVHCLVDRMQKYIRPGMLLLEGGCGDGRYVRYFSDLGISTIGVDYARATVLRIKEFLPHLDVRVGDIRDLEFPDSHFDAYYSGGVIEHFEDGIGQQLMEAQRVLKKGGYFFVTVPHMNLSRKCAALFYPTQTKFDLDGRKSFHKERVHDFCNEQPPNGYHFHEYFFSTGEMRSFLSTYGFTVIEEMCFSTTHGLCDIEFYRRLVSPNCHNRTIMNKFFAIPLRCIKFFENSESCPIALNRVLGSMCGNLKLYICRASNLT